MYVIIPYYPNDNDYIWIFFQFLHDGIKNNKGTEKCHIIFLIISSCIIFKSMHNNRIVSFSFYIFYMTEIRKNKGIECYIIFLITSSCKPKLIILTVLLYFLKVQ